MSGELQDWDAATYHASPAISRGAILRAAQSIAMFKAYEDGEIEADDSRSMALGTVSHVATLEPGVLERDWVVEPQKNRTLKHNLVDGYREEPDGTRTMGRALHDQWLADNAKKKVTDAPTLALALGVRDAVMRHAAAHRLLTIGNTEQAATFVDEDTGLLCKYLMDGHYHPAKGGIVDLKTCKDPSPAGFNRSAQQNSYHVQDAHYTMGEAARLGVEWHEIPPMVFVAVRNTHPHEVAMYTLPEPERVAGRDICRSALDLIAERRESGDWVPSWSLADNCEAIVLGKWPDWALRNPLENDDV